MCVPVAAAIAVGSFALSTVGDIEKSNAQNTAARNNAASANAAQATDLNSLSLRGAQEQRGATDQDQIVDKKLTLDKSLSALGSAENGVAGNSTDALQQELEFQKGMYHDSVAENLSNQLGQITQEKAGVVARTTSRINSVQPSNPLAVGLQIAGNAIQLGTTMGRHSGANPDGTTTPPTSSTGGNADYLSSALQPIGTPIPMNPIGT